MASAKPIRNDFRVFTICARNYIAHASVLAQSLARFNTSLRLTVLLLDDEAGSVDASKMPFDIIRPAALSFSGPSEFHHMATIYDVTELATAVKPWVFEYLFSVGAEVVLYLDPDIEVFASLSELERAAQEHGVVLTPHTLKPLPRDGKIPGERELLLAGAYNLGFLGLSKPAATAFLPWWSERLRRDCRNAVESGYFVDQRWIDLVPGYFDHYIVRDPGYNVAYWNLPTRPVALEGKTFTVDGAPLRFFHFSGFSPERRHLLSKHQGLSPRVLLSDQPALAKLCGDYADNLMDQGYARWSKVDYAFNKAANGLPIDRRMRLIYRDALLAHDNGNDILLCDPFTADGAADFIHWLRYPASPRTPEISRYIHEIYQERADLRAAFPDLTGGDAHRFIQWITDGGRIEPRVPDVLMPEAKSLPAITVEEAAQPQKLKRGVNLYGYVFAESGTGQIGRSIVSALNAAGIPYSVVPFTATINRQKNPFADYGDRTPIYDTNLICVNADQVPVFVEQMGRSILNGRYNIGVWAWEVEEFPDWMARSATMLDEVWGISAFTAASIAKKVTDIPVCALPLPVIAPNRNVHTRAELRLPEGFLFLFCFDFESVFERKNPLATVDAFVRAFPREGEATLYIKTVNGARHLDELERLRSAVKKRRDIIIEDGYRSAEEQAALMASCDAYVSLHRSEGFGLTLSEAMSWAKPVIGTAYSSTAEFMTRNNSYLVPIEMVRIGENSAPYPPDGRWAAPDVAAASRIMREVFENREEAAARGRQARHDMETLHSASARSDLLKRLLSDVESRRERGRFVRPESQAAAPAALVTLPLAPSAPMAPAPFERAEALVHGPNPDLPSRFPRIAGFFRRLMLRVIRNYWVHQSEVDKTLLETIRVTNETARSEMLVMNERLSRKLAAVEAALEHKKTIESVASLQSARLEQALTERTSAEAAATSRYVEALDEKLGQTRKDFDDTSSRLARNTDANARAIRLTQEKLAAANARIEAAEETARQQADRLANRLIDAAHRVDELTGRVDEMSSASRLMHERVHSFEARVLGAINELREQLHANTSAGQSIPALEASLRRLASELHAVPYVTDSRHIRTTDENGSELIGYHLQGDEKPVDFEEVFRGSEEFIRERQRVYIPLLRNAAPVVDLGCGRGEMLDLLQEANIGAVGIELNERLAEYCRAKGHSVVVRDAIEYLEAQQDHSLGGVFSAQFIEHLDQSRLEDLFSLVRRKLRPGGVFVAETVNPHSVPAMKCFWVDPTHKAPIFPETAVTLCRTAGFGQAQILFPNGSGALDDDLFSQGEYAVIATEPRMAKGEEDTSASRMHIRSASADEPPEMSRFVARHIPRNS